MVLVTTRPATANVLSKRLCGAHFAPALATIPHLDTAAVVLRWDLILNIGDRQYNYQCQTTSFYAWEETLGCVNTVTSSLTTTWTVVEISGERTASVLSEGHPGGLNAFGIQLVSRVSRGPAAETSSDSSNSNAEQSTGIAVGAAVGITVGALVALLAIVSAIFIFMRRRRRELIPAQGPQPHMHEMGCDTETRFYEAPGTPVFDPRFATYEIDSQPVAVKNPGRYRYD
ncbi:hypothetical protein DL767_007549 [Monosporascus sp. MG133]|nr:hypothetical protein DL767_007549 [Monosporascus sp. MG133]